MSNLSLNNLAITATNNAMTATIGHLFDTLQSKIANGGRDTNCKFYYSGPGAGGSILQVATKGIVGGAVSLLKDEAVNAFNSLLDKKKDVPQNGEKWFEQVYKENKEDSEKYGKFLVNNKTNTVYALDDWGNVCCDALMLGVEVENPVTVFQQMRSVELERNKNGRFNIAESKLSVGEFESDHLVWYDTTALITINSDKNLVISRVQGRDCSRKELVSNGDIKFSVTGQITSGKPDVYPAKEIQKFTKVMQYKGIVKVNNEVLDQFGITHILITDFNITSKEGYKSLQNYTFNAIGLQPEKEIEINEDTITYIEQKPMSSDSSDDLTWKSMLQNQLAGLKSMTKDLASQGAALATGLLDSKL